jgi:hypothetical protein
MLFHYFPHLTLISIHHNHIPIDITRIFPTTTRILPTIQTSTIITNPVDRKNNRLPNIILIPQQSDEAMGRGLNLAENYIIDTRVIKIPGELRVPQAQC